MDDLNLTVEQYQDAIKNALSYRQVELLQILYAFPNSTATAKELAAVISPKNPSPIVASGQIGKIGKAIATYLGVTPWLYHNGKNETPAYFSLVGPYFASEGKLSNERPGWEMKENLRTALESLNLVGHDEEDVQTTEKLPTEEQFDHQLFYKEGKVVQVFVNRYERNQKARLECIKHHGDSCFVCGFSFGQFYGDTAKGFIHVHHKTQLSDIGEEYEVDPINDLVPLCANCHSVVHLTNPALTVEELKRLTKKSSR
ncbi:MAG: HNH endonuclease [Chitinophagaceae bacterium]|nr:HNH endonuclease [Chitinophagaceae bacterium]